jgi:hypothetical protein
VDLNKENFEEVPIYRATKNFVSLQILQPVSIICEPLRDFEGADTKVFEFTMISLILLRCIPFKYEIFQLEILLIALPVKGLLDSFLMIMCSFRYLLSSMFHLYQLMNPPDHVIWMFLVVLEEIFHRHGELRRKKFFNPIYTLERRDAQGPLCCHSISPQRKFEL